MLWLFERKREPPAAGAVQSPPVQLPKGLTRPEPAASLLDTPRRRKLLENIWQRTSLSRRQFATLYRAPLERYAELVQQFPASENHHHAYPGGMLDHGLEIVAYALQLRRSRLLPSGVAPEDQAAQSEAWTAAVAYAALLHDIGKIAVDLEVELANGAAWHAWHGPLQQPYRFRYRDDRQYRLHGAATGLLYRSVLGREVLDWLSGFPTLWSALLYVLAGQYEHAGELGELVTQADQASVAQALGGDPARAIAAQRHSLPQQLLQGLRYLLNEELKLNQPGASDGWLTQDALWLVSKTVSDRLRAHLLSQGIEGIPANNTTLFNVMQDHGLLQATSEGKAIWKATVASNTGWSHSFTLLRVMPALIWEVEATPAPFAGTVTVERSPEQGSGATEDSVAPATASTATAAAPGPVSARPAARSTAAPGVSVGAGVPTDAVDDLLSMLGASEGRPDEPAAASLPLHSKKPNCWAPDPEQSCAPTRAPPSSAETPSSAHFIAWLRQGILSRKLIINDAKALVHTVAGTVFLVSPGVFQRYVQEHPQVQALAKQEELPDWRWVQQRFERLRVHRKQSDGLNIWTCEVKGPRKSRKLHGYLMDDAATLFDAVPADNPYLSILERG